MSKKFRFLSCLIAVFALALMAVSPVAFAGPEKNEKANENSNKGSENTKGNDRKEGYEDNSSTPQETNHGQGADNDGDADSDPNTAYEDDHTTSDDGDNAHPSGKDRSVEKGKSGNQGKSESNPDDSKGPMRYEGGQGDDKPNGPGGTDRDDQDGNNGCGNDDDFDDDNNGWCGKRVKGTSTPPETDTCPDGSTMPANGKCATQGNADMTIDADCYTVTVTSSKDISYVEVFFTDGTSVKIEGLKGHSFERTFGKEIASAAAKSGTTRVTTVNNDDCGEPAPETCPDGSPMPANGICDDVEGEIIERCPNGDEMPASGDVDDCVEVDENPGNPELCPDGSEMPASGDVEDCDTVLGEIINKDEQPSGPNVLGVRLSPALNEPVTVAGAVLPFTGGEALMFLAAAMALIGAGVMALRFRSNES